MNARIVTPWTGTVASTDPRTPKLFVDHPPPAGTVAVDVTGQPAQNLLPSPNLYVVEVRSVPQSWVDGVEADANY